MESQTSSEENPARFPSPRQVKVGIGEQISPFTSQCPVRLCNWEAQYNRIKGIYFCKSRWNSTGF